MLMLILKDNIIEWQECEEEEEEEEEGGNAQKSECRLFERSNEFHDLQLPWLW
jgi:hypothetical protein